MKLHSVNSFLIKYVMYTARILPDRAAAADPSQKLLIGRLTWPPRSRPPRLASPAKQNVEKLIVSAERMHIAVNLVWRLIISLFGCGVASQRLGACRSRLCIWSRAKRPPRRSGADDRPVASGAAGIGAEERAARRPITGA